MRCYVVLLALALATCACAEDHYPDKYDYIAVAEIVKNDKLREQYYNCFMDTTPCVTPDAKFFKKYLPEAIATQCKKCTEKQKELLDTLAVWYVENQPDKWNAVVEKLLNDAKAVNTDKQ